MIIFKKHIRLAKEKLYGHLQCNAFIYLFIYKCNALIYLAASHSKIA